MRDRDRRREEAMRTTLNRDLAKGTLRGILSEVGMTVQELQRLL